MSILVSVRSETVKLKRTLCIYICLAAAVFGPFMTFIENLDVGPNSKLGVSWTEYFMEGHETLSFALLPLYVILTCTLLLQIEYRDNTWKQLISSPQKLLHIFLSKFIVFQLTILAFMVGHLIFQGIAAWITEMIRSDLYDGKFDIRKILIANTQVYILVLGMTAIQYRLAFRFKSFIASLAIGFALWFTGALIAFEFKWGMVEYYPYAFTLLGAWQKYKANVVTYQWYSIITALVFLGIGYAEFSRKKIRA